MKLHQNTKLFEQTLRAASQHLRIKMGFIEKDYWITIVLKRLSKSNYVQKAVFKGGTSLSKAYKLIDRFSEDIDIAIIPEENHAGNVIKTSIRNIQKEITSDLNEIKIEGVTSKGSRFRRAVFEYESIKKANSSNKLLVEINSFANPFPYQPMFINSMVYEFLMQNNHEKYIEEYELEPFEVNVLSKEQTLLEKLVSLIRFSFMENSSQGLSGKIRHFYDLYYLANDADCKEFIDSNSFKNKFIDVLQHDKEIFEEPADWKSKEISDSPLIKNFPEIWKNLKDRYNFELTALAYRPIPNEDEIEKSFLELLRRIL